MGPARLRQPRFTRLAAPALVTDFDAHSAGAPVDGAITPTAVVMTVLSKFTLHCAAA